MHSMLKIVLQSLHFLFVMSWFQDMSSLNPVLLFRSTGTHLESLSSAHFVINSFNLKSVSSIWDPITL